MAKSTTSTNVAQSNFADRVVQGVAAFVIIGLAFQNLVQRYVHADAPINYALAGGFLMFVIYSLLAPFFRK